MTISQLPQSHPVEPMPARILLVDDEIAVARAVQRALGKQTYAYRVSNLASDAIAILEKEPVDLIISDFDMPGMNGLELMRAARAIQPGAVRILLTGINSMDVVVAAINEGEVHRFVRKPPEPKKLRELVAAGLSRQRELARQTAIAHKIARERELLTWLNQYHPDIEVLSRDANGCYQLDSERIKRTAVELGLGELIPADDPVQGQP